MKFSYDEYLAMVSLDPLTRSVNLLNHIIDTYGSDRLVDRFAKAILDVVDGLATTPLFCPYTCPTTTALQHALYLLEGNKGKFDSLVERLDNMRNDIYELRLSRIEYYGADLMAPGSPEHDALMTIHMSAQRAAGREIMGKGSVELMINSYITTREKSAEILIRLLGREKDLYEERERI